MNRRSFLKACGCLAAGLGIAKSKPTPTYTVKAVDPKAVSELLSSERAKDLVTRICCRAGEPIYPGQCVRIGANGLVYGCEDEMDPGFLGWAKVVTYGAYPEYPFGGGRIRLEVDISPRCQVPITWRSGGESFPRMICHA